MERCAAHHLGLAAMCDDQARVCGQQLPREVQVDGEIEFVGIFPVFRPFLVHEKIAGAGFYLDADEPAFWAQRQDVRPAAVRQRHLVHRGPAELQAEPGGGAADGGGSFGEG